MFGSVPVRIRGPVSRGSIVYASPEHPGMAVSGSTIGYSSSLRNDAAAIGMAWQSMKCDEDEVSLNLNFWSRPLSNSFSLLKHEANACSTSLTLIDHH